MKNDPVPEKPAIVLHRVQNSLYTLSETQMANLACEFFGKIVTANAGLLDSTTIEINPDYLPNFTLALSSFLCNPPTNPS